MGARVPNVMEPFLLDGHGVAVPEDVVGTPATATSKPMSLVLTGAELAPATTAPNANGASTLIVLFEALPRFATPLRRPDMVAGVAHGEAVVVVIAITVPGNACRASSGQASAGDGGIAR